MRKNEFKVLIYNGWLSNFRSYSVVTIITHNVLSCVFLPGSPVEQ